MSYHLTPLEVVECLVAPLRDLHKFARCHPKSPYKWRFSAQTRDAGDLPPRINRTLLAWARKNGVPLTADHLIFGADHADIVALCAGLGRDMPPHLRLVRREVAAE